MIQPVLGVQRVNHPLLNRLYDNNRSVEVRFLVGFPDYPLNEGTEEVPLSELDDLFGVLFRLRGGSPV